MVKSHEEELAHKRQHHADHRDADNIRCLAYNAAHVEQIAEYKRNRPKNSKASKTSKNPGVSRTHKAIAYKAKICLECGQVYQPTGCRQKRCSGCVAQYETNHKAAWYLAHPEYYIEHREEIRAKAAVQHLEHPEKARATSAAYRAVYPMASAKWRAAHPAQWAAIRRKHQAKRRDLGFVPLNEFFDGSEAHHLNQIPGEVIYIPKEIHRSLYHNVWTGQGMAQVNALAYAFMLEQNLAVVIAGRALIL